MNADEQKLLDDIAKTRKTCIGYRDAMMTAKRAGQAEEANRMHDEQFLPAAKTYIAALKAFLDFQHDGIDAAAKQVDATAAEARWQVLTIGDVALFFGALCAWTLTRSITRPIADAMDVADAVARGDLSRAVVVAGRDEMARLMSSLGKMTGNLRTLVSQVRSSTDSIGTASSEIATGNQDLSTRTEEAASSLQETASSMEQLTSTVRRSADAASQANQLASSAEAPRRPRKSRPSSGPRSTGWRTARAWCPRPAPR